MDDTHYRILKCVEENPDTTQRELARQLSVSLGKANYCLKSSMDVGWIRMQNFRNSENRLVYAYILTPQGAAGKDKILLQSLKRKMNEYQVIKAQIEELESELRRATVDQNGQGEQRMMEDQ